MAKRYTDSEKWKTQWFRQLKPVHKCFYVYLLDNCDYAGVWDVDFDAASFYVGENLDPVEITRIFFQHAYPFAAGRRWFLLNFIEYQYGELNPNNRAHLSVIGLLKKFGIFEIYLSRETAERDQAEKILDPCENDLFPCEKILGDKNKTIQKKLNQIGSSHLMPAKPDPESVPETRRRITKIANEGFLANSAVAYFDAARKSYPGTRNGLSVEWANFARKYGGEIEKVLPLLSLGIQREVDHRVKMKTVGRWVPEWKIFQTWVNNRCWEQEFEKIEEQNGNNWGARKLTKSEKLDRDAENIIREHCESQAVNREAAQTDFSFVE